MKKRQFVHSFILLIILVVVVTILFSYSNLKFTGLPIDETLYDCGGWSNLSQECGTRECTSKTNSSDVVIDSKTCEIEPVICTENWTCGNWGTCTNGSQTRTCTDSAGCNSTVNTESQACAICGNGIVETGETCEINSTQSCTTGGYTGIQNCGSNCDWGVCTATQSCGDGTINGNEECEGTDLGTHTCEDEGFDGGTLTCKSDCTLNNEECTEESTEESSEESSEEESNVQVPVTASVTEESCTPNPECGEWQECINGTQTRICKDLNQCNPDEVASTESQSCVVEIKETCFDRIKNQNETGIDCGGSCEKKCSLLTIVGSAITGPINVGKKFILEGMFGNITRTAISIGILVVIAGGILVGRFFLKKKRRKSKKFEKATDDMLNEG